MSASTWYGLALRMFALTIVQTSAGQSVIAHSNVIARLTNRRGIIAGWMRRQESLGSGFNKEN